MASSFILSLLTYGASVALAAPVKLVSQDFASGSVVYDLGEARYMTPFKAPYASISGKKAVSIEANTPTVALWFNSTKTITKAAVEEQLKLYYDLDDVLSASFLSTVLISSTGSTSLSKDAMAYFEELGLEAIFVDHSIKTVPSSKKVKAEKVDFTYKKYDAIEGPFLATPTKAGISFYPVYRIYVDEFRDFVFGAYPENHPTDNYAPFLGHSAKFVDPLVPVPSRIYSLRDERPLAGKRIAIKDIYDIKGLQTAAGNRAYTDLYGAANMTGPAAQRLLDLGVVVIGKTKTAQYASGESLNDNWLEVQYPFNARGDHWQTCSASSSGSGCAMAAYDWLDLATGSDTGSSMRRPAAVAGVYGNRPSHGIIALEGVVPLVTRQDTLGIFSRDAVLWNKAAHAWYADSPLELIDYKGVPSKVLYPTDYLPMANPDAEAVLQSFLGKLNAELGMETVYFNFSQTTLESSSPVNNFTAIGAAYSGGGANDGFLDAGLAVIENYKAQNGGRFPPLNPSTRSGWQRSYAAGLGAPTAEAVAAADAVAQEIREWWSNDFLGTNPESCSEGIMIYDIGTRGLPSYREASLNTRFGENGAVTIPVTYNNTAVAPATISPYIGNPDFTIHIGEVEYMSAITQVMEKLPVSLSIMSNPGCDFMLFNFIERLQNMGIIRASKTGRSMY